MPKYILNKNKQDSSSGSNYELHNEDSGACIRLPKPENRLQVGTYSNCRDAIAAARRQYPAMAPNIDGCYYCCPDCHNE